MLLAYVIDCVFIAFVVIKFVDVFLSPSLMCVAMAIANVRTDSAALQGKLDEITALLAEVTGNLRNKRRQKRRAAQPPQRLLLMCKMLCCRLDGVELIPEFLRRQPRVECADVDRWACRVRKWFDVSSAEERSLVLHGASCPARQKAADAVDKWLNERKLYLWVKKQNLDKGIAPCTGNVMSELPNNNLMGVNRYDKSLPRSYRGTLQYLKRWRRRWGVRSGKILARDEVDAETLRDKVYHFDVEMVVVA
jgi:hypothetical protein